VKRLSLTLAIALFVGVIFGSLAFAQPQNSYAGGYYCPYMQRSPDLTDEQREQITQWQNQMIDNRKQVLQKQVEWNWLTQTQADQQINYMHQWQNNGYGMWMMGSGWGGGSMMGHGMMGGGMMGHGVMGMGMMWGGQGYYCPYLRQSPALTDEQREQITQWQNQMIDNRKQVLQKQVEWGWITQDQADQQIKYMNQWQKNGYGMWMHGY